MAVTIRQVAEETGLSVETVSHVLNSKKKGLLYREETRRRVIAAAQAMGYRRNATARAMRKGTFDCVAVILSTNRRLSLLSSSTLHGMCDVLAQRNMHLTVAKFPDDQLCSDGFVPKILRESMADGLVINYTHEMPERMIHLVEQFDIPSVWLNNKRPHDCVHPDDYSATRDATRKLLQLGHRRIGYAGCAPMEHYSFADRKAGYADVMREAGLKPDFLMDGIGWGASAERMARAMAVLDRPDRPTAIVFYSGSDAGTFGLAAVQAGLVIPQDLSLVTVSDEPVGLGGLAVTTMAIDAEEAGRAAIEMLLKKIAAPRTRVPGRAIPMIVHEGQTTAPPRSGAA